MIELRQTVFETDYELRELMLEVPKSDQVETGTMAVFHNASIRLIRVIVEVQTGERRSGEESWVAQGLVTYIQVDPQGMKYQTESTEERHWHYSSSHNHRASERSRVEECSRAEKTI